MTPIRPLCIAAAGLMVAAGKTRSGGAVSLRRGDTWSMVSDEVEFTTDVEVTGRRADASFCMQGQGTLEVSSIDEVQPPR